MAGSARACKQAVVGGDAHKSSARAGLLPVALAQLPIEALAGLPVYIRVGPKTGGLGHEDPAGKGMEGFRLYSAADMRFTDFHRQRLVDHDVKFIYLKVTDQARLYGQIGALAGAPGAAGRETPELIIYETSIELMNELLVEPDLLLRSARLEQYSRSITTLVLNKPEAFEHLVAACRHDYYTATHMVGVATWIVPLAHELGHTRPEELSVICEAGLLHDIGKLSVPAELLNKNGKLTEEEWKLVRTHPEAGRAYLAAKPGVNEVVLRVASEHHERLDGSGYPGGLKGEQIHPVSRMCAVVDSFAAMTAFRPFRERPLSVKDAVACLYKEQGKYDPKALDAFARMMKQAQAAPALTLAGDEESRAHARRRFQCPALVHVVGEESASQGTAAMKVITQSISRCGLGFLSHRPIEEGEVLRVYIQAKGWEKRALEGRVVRCRTFDEQWHEVGIQFSTMQDQADIGGG